MAVARTAPSLLSVQALLLSACTALRALLDAVLCSACRRAFRAHAVQALMLCLLDAVAHMHAHGISHRDLKLENLVLARPGDVTSVTIVDFGLAKVCPLAARASTL